jgi:hypothetical protein
MRNEKEMKKHNAIVRRNKENKLSVIDEVIERNISQGLMCRLK